MCVGAYGFSHVPTHLDGKSSHDPKLVCFLCKCQQYNNQGNDQGLEWSKNLISDHHFLKTFEESMHLCVEKESN